MVRKVRAAASNLRRYGLVSVAAFGSVCLPSCKCENAQPPPVAASASAAPRAPALLHTTVENVPAPPDIGAPPSDAEKTTTGLATKVLQAGTGTAHPVHGDVMAMNYVGWKKDGKMFDRSVGDPPQLSFGMLFPGWAEAMQLMVAGEKRRVWIPAALAFGDHDGPGTPAGDLVMDVELVRVLRGGKLVPSASAASSAKPAGSVTPPAPSSAKPKVETR